MANEHTADWDVAVVGAGVSGTYTAWRLAQAGKKVALFEASQRIGGRLFSAQPKGMPHLRAELGGMRFPHHHQFVWALAEELGLKRTTFPNADDVNFFFLRGRRLAPEELADPEKVPYFLAPEERGKDPESLLFELFMRTVPGFEEYEWSEWQTRRQEFPTFDGKLLSNVGFWNLLYPHCSKEAYDFIREAAGYDTAFGNCSAADDLYFMLEHIQGDGTASGLEKGLASLPQELAKRFEDLGGKVELGCPLAGFAHQNGLVDLQFADGHTQTASELVLAMPRRSLELLSESNPLFAHSTFLEDLQAVAGVNACKIFVGFDRPWWRDQGIQHGRTSTDLPLRQCYYFGTEGEQEGADPENTNSLLMAGYNDGTSVDYWEGYQPTSYIDHLLGHTPIAAHDNTVPSAMLEEIHRQLELIHGCKVPEPYTAHFQDWRSDPYGGGWHAWQIHSKRVEVMKRMRKPVEHLPVYICGEAYSNTHGWAQGALNSAELVCQEQLGLPAIDCLPEGHLLD